MQKRAFGALPLPRLRPRRRLKRRKNWSNSVGSGDLSNSWVGFPPAPLYRLPVPPTSTVLTPVFHFLPHLTRKSLIVKRKLEGRVPTVGPIRQTTTSCG